MEDITQNVKFFAHIHQIGCLQCMVAGFNPDKPMNPTVGDKIVNMSSNTKYCWLCQFCGAYCCGYFHDKSKHDLS